MTLYELTGEYKIFQERFDRYCELVESGDIPEQAIWDTLDAIDGAFEEKIDNMACIYKQAMYEVAMIDAEEKRLKERKAAKKAAAERLAQYMSRSMQCIGIEKVETARTRISFRKSRKVVIDDEEGFVQWASEYNPDLLSYKPPEPNKTVIKKIIDSGETIEGARVEVCANLQVK